MFSPSRFSILISSFRDVIRSDQLKKKTFLGLRPQDTGHCMTPFSDKDTWHWLRMLQEILEAGHGGVLSWIQSTKLNMVGASKDIHRYSSAHQKYDMMICSLLYEQLFASTTLDTLADVWFLMSKEYMNSCKSDT